jgi:MOSC domain-containing protein YiiM
MRGDFIYSKRLSESGGEGNVALRKLGVVGSIQIAKAAGEPMISVSQARAVPGQGLEGDRYFKKIGTYSDNPKPGRDLTLVEFEAIEALMRDYGIDIDQKDFRRNIVTRGVPLNHLVGKEFKIGEVTVRGIRLCEPCSHLEGLTRKGVEAALTHRGGLRVDILTPEMIHVGDEIQEI